MVLSSWQSHCESSPGSFDECRMAPSGRRPKTKLDDLGCESACAGCQSLHPPSPCIIITQPESWYSFHRPTEGRRLSRPSWLVTYRDGLPACRWTPIYRRSPIVVLTGSDIAQRHWSKPTRYHYAKPPTNDSGGVDDDDDVDDNNNFSLLWKLLCVTEIPEVVVTKGIVDVKCSVNYWLSGVESDVDGSAAGTYQAEPTTPDARPTSR